MAGSATSESQSVRWRAMKKQAMKKMLTCHMVAM
jgi:hypothetical protein